MAILVGETIRAYITLRDSVSTPILDAATDITITVQTAPTGGAFTGLATNPTDAGFGVYYYQFSPTVAGQYRLQARYAGNTAPTPQDFEEEWDVDSATTGAPTVTVVTTTGGATLQRLRRDIGRNLGDLVVATATSAGTTDTFFDDTRLIGPRDAYKDRTALFVTGTAANLGLTRRVVGSSQDNASVTFRPALPAAIAVADQIELFSAQGQGWTPDAIQDAINESIRDAFPLHTVELVADITAPVAVPTTWLDSTIAVPAAFTHLTGIEYQDANGNWREFPPQFQREGPGFRIDIGNALVVLGADATWTLNGQNVRLRGYGQPAELVTDSDRTSVNAEWIVANCCAKLLSQATLLNRYDMAAGSARMWQQRADALRGRVRTILGATAVKVR